MKTSLNKDTMPGSRAIFGLLALCALALTSHVAHAGVAYGTINNFDTVNDTGEPCHGFEIEIDDIHSKDVTYCYSYNHYGTPTITENDTDPLHPKVFVRYAAIITNGVWSAYTAVPSGPIAPTQGHQFTNPSLNFGGEHFGVGYYGSPAAIKYNWLVDNGAGVLVQGPAVMVSTPIFTYNPPGVGIPAQVQAVVQPAPELPEREFGTPSWVKAIVTSSHTNREVKLRDLVSPDPDFPGEKDWRNGEPDEVETEWDLLQVEYASTKTNELSGRPEHLSHGDEIITRRYEFYAYVGPIDPGSGEALADNVGPDGIHGINQYSNTVVVGDYLGAQMSAFDKELRLGLIDHLADGVINTVYPTRTMVVAGVPFTATNTPGLPPGMIFDPATGELSGTPTASGIFTFTVRVSATNQPTIEKSYTFAITPENMVLPPHSTVDTVAAPLDWGNTSGTGLYTNGNNATVTATASRGYNFSKWTDNGAAVSSNATLQFAVILNRSLVANFVLAPPALSVLSVQPNSLTIAWPTNQPGYVLQQSSGLADTNWSNVLAPVSTFGGSNQVMITPLASKGFLRLKGP